MRRFLRYILLVTALISAATGYSQFYNGSQVEFGKNRVQYFENRIWFYYRFTDFNTYYYRGGRDLAIYTYRYANQELERMQDELDYSLNEKVHFLIFQSLNDLKESNVGLISDEQYNVGGVTHLVGNKVFIYFNGNHAHLERQIRTGIANVLVNQMLMGSNVAAAVKNSTLLALPEWYKNGLISYLAEPWSTTTDNYVRDGILSERYEDFNSLMGEDATYAGHSIWKFIADKYGERVIPNIIYMTKASRNIESAFLYILGTSYNTLVSEWRDYYYKMYIFNGQEQTKIGDDVLQKRMKKDYRYYNPRISPDGKWVVYSSNRLGKMKIYLKNLETGKREKIFRQGHKLDQKVDYSYPIIAWHPTSRLFIMLVERKGENFMYYYDMQEESLERQELFEVQKVLDIDYNHTGSKIVMSAVKDGQTDLYVYNLGSETFEQITNDIYDDMHPRFVNNSEDIVFSSNRTSDTLRNVRLTFRERDRNDTINIPEHRDIFVYHYSTGSRKLWQITNTPYINETHPEEYKKGYVAYLSDHNGIKNRFIAKFDSAISYVDTTVHYRYFSQTYPLTNYSRSILEHDISLPSGKLVEHVYHDGYDKIFVRNLTLQDTLDESILENTVFRNQVIAKHKREIPVEKEKKKQLKEKRFVPLMESDLREEIEPLDSGEVNIEDYIFESEADSEERRRQLQQQKQKGKSNAPVELNYYVEYSINKLVSQMDFSFMSESYQPFTGGGAPIFLNAGFSGLFMVGATDLMEDFRLTGGVRLSPSLRNNEYMLSYENLKHRLDQQWVFHRKSYENPNSEFIQRISSHTVYYKIKYPFSQVFSFRGTASLRYDRSTILATDYLTLEVPNIYYTWAGLKSQLVFDNTRNRGINTLFGSRGKVFGEFSQLVDHGPDNVNLFVVGLDLRHYLPIHRTFVWANRFAASTSFGSSRLIYYMGGVDNWLAPKFNRKIPIDYDQNYAFQTLATPMRGFQQNIRNGNTFALYNTELRFPVVRYFAKKPLRSEFLSSLQLVGFMDIGSAWTGLNPYSYENTVIESKYYEKPFRITVKRMVEPMIGGAGAGLRAKLFGYFIRVDYAWGYTEGNVQDPRIYLSFNLDF